MTSISDWGPKNSPEFPGIMVGIVVICSLAILSSIFPIVELVINIVLSIASVIAVGYLLKYVHDERKIP